MQLAKLTTDPRSAGLPWRYEEWRPGQLQAAAHIVNGQGNMVLTAPTGFGKSLLYVAAANVMRMKTVVLTSTKALQDQLMADFKQTGMVEVRGKANYKCIANHGPTAEHGKCNLGAACRLRGRCPYFKALQEFAKSRLGVTNYAMWMNTSRDVLDAELLILDEGHAAPEQLANYLTVEFDGNDLRAVLGDSSVEDEDWGYIVSQGSDLRRGRESCLQEDPELQDVEIRDHVAKLTAALRIIDKIERIYCGETVVTFDKTRIKMAPVDVAGYWQCLSKGAPKSVIISATATAKTAAMLGLDCPHYEFPSPFPVENRPVYYIPTQRVDKKTEDLRMWVNRIDQIIRKRLDRKGIIHTVSYDRAKYLVEHSEYANIMMRHNTGSAVKAAKAFARAKAPVIMVSPSMSTGWDFPYDKCEYQILAKVPFPDARDPVLAARCEHDKTLPMYMAWQELVQASGRGMRAADDHCEVFIIDDHFQWFWKRHINLAPGWFLEAVQKVATIPDPPPKMDKRRRSSGPN